MSGRIVPNCDDCKHDSSRHCVDCGKNYNKFERSYIEPIQMKKAIEKIKTYYYTEYPTANRDLIKRAIELDIANLKLAEENRTLKNKNQ